MISDFYSVRQRSLRKTINWSVIFISWDTRHRCPNKPTPRQSIGLTGSW